MLSALHGRGIPFKQHGFHMFFQLYGLRSMRRAVSVFLGFGSVLSLLMHPNFWATEKVVLDPDAVHREESWTSWEVMLLAFFELGLQADMLDLSYWTVQR